MKKVMAMVLALFFVAATSNLVLAQAPAASTPAKTPKHSHKKHHTKKKSSPSSPSAATTAK